MFSWQEAITNLKGKTPHEKRVAFEEYLKSWDEDREGPFPVYSPTDERIQSTNIFSLMLELNQPTFREFHNFSIKHRDIFWEKTLSRIGIIYKEKYEKVLDESGGAEFPQWLKGAKLNIVDSCFKAPGNKTAIIFQKENGSIESTSYEELNALSSRIASSLAGMGLKKGDAIAIVMAMNLESIALYLGIVKAGMVVVSIADSFASEEIKTRLRIAQAKLVFTQEFIFRGGKKIDLKTRVQNASNLPLIVLENTFKDFLKMGTNDFISVEMDPEDFSNILFSSGTTSDPKAIPWNHLTPIKCASDGFYHQDIKPEDVVCWPTNLGWMMGPWLIYASLINNASMAIYEGLPTSLEFGHFIQKAKVSILGLIPSLVKSWRSSQVMKDSFFSSIKCFSSTGECSNFEDYFYLMSLANFKPIVEYCGGTEIGGGYIGGSLVQPCSPGSFSTPILGIDFRILNESGEEADEGEVFLIPPSIGLSTTLLNGDHHKVYFEHTPQGLRRHGDQIKKLPKGYYRGQGRADDTMNLGGIKVSCAEIERILNNLEGVDETAAVAVEPKGGGASLLVIFAVTKDKFSDLKLIFQNAISEKLNPLFKVSDVVLVPSLPRTASNKIMRRVLRSSYVRTSN